MTEVITDSTAKDMSQGPLILVADDEPTLLDIYSTSFKTNGFRVVTAADGVEALDAAVKNHPDLIVLDVIMPIKDGFETLRDLKANPKTSSIPVIVLSNLGQDFEKKRGIDLGATTFLVKADVEPSTLIRRVRHMLETPATN